MRVLPALAAMSLLPVPGAVRATPPALPCTSDYKWPQFQLPEAIRNGDLSVIAEWLDPDVRAVSYDREVARGVDAVSKLVAQTFPATRAPVKLLAMDTALLATFTYTGKYTGLYGKPTESPMRGGMLFRCKDPGTISEVEFFTENSWSQQQLERDGQ